MSSFRVLIDGDLLAADGSPAFGDFDLSGLDMPQVEHAYLTPGKREIGRAEVEDCDALILWGSRFTAASIPTSGRLAIVARAGVGYDNVDVGACREAGIAVTITPDGVRRPVAVSILALLLALSSRLLVKDKIGRAGGDRWAEKNLHTGISLTGRTLGSIGLGNIAREMFRLAAPLGMRFIAADPFGSATDARQLGVEMTDLEKVFRESDFLAVNCPLTEQTRGLVNAERLAMMKSAAFLINTARGPIVDQGALADALSSGVIAGAGLDVLEREPPDPSDPILRLDNVIVTPHALCWTDELFRGLAGEAVAATLEVMRGRIPRVLVDGRVADIPAFRAKLAAKAAEFPAK